MTRKEQKRIIQNGDIIMENEVVKIFTTQDNI